MAARLTEFGEQWMAELKEAHVAVDRFELGAVLDSYVATTKALGLEPIPDMVERCVVNDELRLAGTCDNIVRATRQIRVGDIVIEEGQYVVSDKKTTKESSLRYSWLSFGVQLAIYATADALYDPATGERTPMPPQLRRDVALVCHLNIPEGACTYYAIPLGPMVEALQLSFKVEEYRSLAATMAQPLPVPKPAPVDDTLLALRRSVVDSLAACSADREQILARWNDEGLDVPANLTAEQCKHALAVIARLDELALTAAQAGPTSKYDELRALVHLAAMVDENTTSSKFLTTLDELDALTEDEIDAHLERAWAWIDENSVPTWKPDEIREAIDGLPLDLAESVAMLMELDGFGSLATLEGAPPSALTLFGEMVYQARTKAEERAFAIELVRTSVSHDNRTELDTLHSVDINDASTCTRVNTLKAAGVYQAYRLGLIDTDGNITAKQAQVMKSFGGARKAREAGETAASLLHEKHPRTGKEVMQRGGALFFVAVGHHHHHIL